MSQTTLAPDADRRTDQAAPTSDGGGGKGLLLAVLAFALVPVIIIAGLFGYMVLLARTEAAQCLPHGPSVQVNAANMPAGPVAGFGTEQLGNAAAILAASAALGLGQRDQTVGVMTAIGESSLRVLDRGDAVGPDSRGLFQQRDNGAWGTYAQRMDPTASATSYFQVLAQVPDRESKSPTQVAHAVQRNADPNYYSQFWDEAVTITAALTASAGAPANPAQARAALPAAARSPAGAAQDAPVAAAAAVGAGGGAAGGAGDAAACAGTPGAGAAVNAVGWSSPAQGRLSSPFGWRTHPISGTRKFHYGTDIANACGTPIYAAADGTVTRRDFDSGGNGVIAIDNGTATINGNLTPIYTRYLHEYESGMFVNVGDVVKAGQQIGEIGSSGGSTGCHLHYEVNVGGSPVDPVAFMADRGITLGS